MENYLFLNREANSGRNGGEEVKLTETHYLQIPVALRAVLH